MNAGQYLFVGGPWDGRVEYLKESHASIVVAEYMTGKYVRNRIRDHAYRRVMMSSGENLVSIYVSSRVDDSEIMNRLIAGYRRPTSPAPSR